MTDKSEIILYQPNNEVSLEVRVDNETIWLTQIQIAELFGVGQPAISKHLKNIYASGELREESTYSILEYMGNDGKQLYKVKYYNLDAILSIGYRVNSINATRFRQWANIVLKDYLLKGYAINQRILAIEDKVEAHSQQLQQHQKQIDFFVRTSLPPVEGIFYDGQIFDAFAFFNNLIRSAKKRIVLIDNYVDETMLLRLTERQDNVSAKIYTKIVSPSFDTALQQHNQQYPQIEVVKFEKSHDRFLLIDDEVYHIGASIKDLGKKWFAFCKLELPADEIIDKLEV